MPAPCLGEGVWYGEWGGDVSRRPEGVFCNLCGHSLLLNSNLLTSQDNHHFVTHLERGSLEPI